MCHTYSHAEIRGKLGGIIMVNGNQHDGPGNDPFLPPPPPL